MTRKRANRAPEVVPDAWCDEIDRRLEALKNRNARPKRRHRQADPKRKGVVVVEWRPILPGRREPARVGKKRKARGGVLVIRDFDGGDE